MAEIKTLEALQAFHQELVAFREGRADGAVALENELLVHIFEQELSKLWARPRKEAASRSQVESGKVTIEGETYSINEDFRRNAFMLADELDLNEVEAVKYLLESQQDPPVLGRSLLECAIVRFHQQRKYAVDSLRVLLEIESLEDEVEDARPLESLILYVNERLLKTDAGSKRYVPRCVETMTEIRVWAQQLGEKISAARTLLQSTSQGVYEELETVEFSRVSLIQQHEALGVILCRIIEKRQAQTGDFLEYIAMLKRTDRYDILLVHLIPALGAFITLFGSTEGGYDLIEVRGLNAKLFPVSDEATWHLPYLQAAVRAWWLAEYSGFYLDDPPESAIPSTADLEQEDRERSKQFLDALKDGAFDFLLSTAADVKQRDWQDPVRAGMRKWLQRKSPALSAESAKFSGFFQLRLMVQLEVFVDAFISNLPDVLRRLRVEEDEQRQLSQAHEQDLDLERFLLLIAYAYEGRSEAASTFWSDPDSNLAGFMHWASRRASTPLVTAFCEMLQAISDTDENATAAHEFLLDEGHLSSGKMTRSLSLTWTQIFKELEFFCDKVKQKPAPTTASKYRSGKPVSDQVEVEPESAMMLESYLRLMSKLSDESEVVREFLLQNQYNIVTVLLELASSNIPPRLRGCIFVALKSLMTRRTLAEGRNMWVCLEAWLCGGYAGTGASQQRQTQQSSLASMDRIFDEISNGFEDPQAFVQLLTALISPAADSSALNDALSFPENLGSTIRVPGIEVYVDFVMGLVFSSKANNIADTNQLRELRLICLDFIWMSLTTFNEELIVMANSTNIMIDSVISTSDLATYVRMHPFARVMEWMFNDKVMAALFDTVSQPIEEVGNAPPDSSLLWGIFRGIEVISKVLDLQATYLDVVRPLLKARGSSRRQPVADTAYASFEDGLVTKINLVVNLGSYCGLGHPDLTLASLKLLEKMSSSSAITANWSGPSRYAQPNKAIVAMEANREHEFISRSFMSELSSQMEFGREGSSPSYHTKIYILDFLSSCLQETPRKPTIGHLLLGFKCGVDSISIEPGSSFASQTSLFHSLLRLLFDHAPEDALGVRQWSIAIRSRVMRIFRILWTSSLSAPLVIEELRENEFLFHLLLRESVIQPDLLWEGQNVAAPEFPVTDGVVTLLDFLALRDISFEYIATELCLISQGRMPSVKRRIFEALNGQIIGDDNEPIQTPTVFDLYDFLLPVDLWAIPEPQLSFHDGLDLSICQQTDDDGNTIHNVELAKEVLLLKRSESHKGAVMAAGDVASIEMEESMIIEWLVANNRQKQITTQGLKVLQAWVKLLLVMIQCNDFKGTARTSFLLQALQAILPSLEAFSSDRTQEAYGLAKLANVLLSKLHGAMSESPDETSLAIGHLVGDKLFQLFQTCLQAIGKWAGTSDLRAVYYETCFRYLISMSDDGPLSSGRSKAFKTVHVYGERLINVICDDAYSGAPASQTAALILLNALITLGREEDDIYVVDTLNKLNFIGILVDSLKNINQEWHEVYRTGDEDQQNFQNARLALLLQLCQTRAGAKNVLHANLFRAIETSGLFTADPELQASTENPRALTQHYELLAKVIRVIGAALLSRGSHNIDQGRRFLTNHRMLVTHTLKRSAGIGGGGDVDQVLDDRVDELADGFMVLIATTGFIEFEDGVLPQPKPQDKLLFH